MTINEIYDKLKKINIFSNNEREVDESKFSSDLTYKDIVFKVYKNSLFISWQTKYWDENTDEQEKALLEIYDTVVYWIKKLNITDKVGLYIEICPAACSEWDAEADDAFICNNWILNED